MDESRHEKVLRLIKHMQYLVYIITILLAWFAIYISAVDDWG